MLASLVDGVWFSTDSPASEEPVTIYVAVRNEATSTIAGKVIFSIDSENLPPVDFSVPAKGLVRVSKEYNFPRGKHSVSAQIEGESTSLGNRTISVSSPPPETMKEYVQEAGRTVVDTVEPIADKIEQRLEKTRDALAKIDPEIKTKKDSPLTTFVEKSKEIAAQKDVPFWRRTAAFALGALIIPVHYWMWVLGLVLIGIVFRMLRD